MGPGQPAQLGLLVLVAQRDDPGRHRVVVDADPLATAEHDVELAHQRELARCGRAQVARADDEPTIVAEEEHAPNLTPPTDTAEDPDPAARHPAQIQLGNHIRQRQCSYGMVSAT